MKRNMWNPSSVRTHDPSWKTDIFREKIQHFHEAIVFQKKLHLGMTRLWQQHGQSMVVPKGIPRKLISQMKKFAMAVCWGVFFGFIFMCILWNHWPRHPLYSKYSRINSLMMAFSCGTWGLCTWIALQTGWPDENYRIQRFEINVQKLCFCVQKSSKNNFRLSYVIW